MSAVTSEPSVPEAGATGTDPRWWTTPAAIMSAVAAVVFAIDHLTKWWALNGLDPHEPTHLFWTVQLNLVFNRGASFSIGESFGWVFGVMAIIVVGVLLRTGVAVTSRLSQVGTGLIVGGALGNLADRLFRADDGFLSGAVVDFVDFQWWPVWNIADAAILVGGGLVVLVASRG